MKRVLACSFFAFVSAIALLSSCKQGEGERCQIQDDCADGLTCSKSTGRCQGSSGSPIDALPPDGEDGPPADAAADAPTDAPTGG